MDEKVVRYDGTHLVVAEPVTLRQIFKQTPMGTPSQPLMRCVVAGRYPCQDRQVRINGQEQTWLVVELDGDTLGIAKELVEIVTPSLA